MMSSDKPTINRWWRLVGGVLLNVCLGSLFSPGVFTPSLRNEFGWSSRQVSLTLALAIFVFALTIVPAGKLQDRRGPALNAYLGAVLQALGFFAASFTSSLTWLYFTLGVLVGLGNGLGYCAPIPVAAKWFPDKRGLAIGIVVAGYPGAALIRPITEHLISDFGWRSAFQILGGLLLVVSLVGATLLRNPPLGAANFISEKREASLEAVVRTGWFYRVWFSYCLAGTGVLMLISQLVPYANSAIQNFSPEQGRLAVTLAAVANASGRIVSGWLSDALGRTRILASAMVISAGACLLAVHSARSAWLYVLAISADWCYGTLLSLFPSMTADAFGTENLGANYGLVFTAWTVAGILGSTLSGRILHMSGTFSTVFYAAAILPLLAAWLLLTRDD